MHRTGSPRYPGARGLDASARPIFDLGGELGRLLAQVRRRAGLTQAQMAETVLVSPRTVRRIEAGEARVITPAVVDGWARACGVRITVELDELAGPGAAT